MPSPTSRIAFNLLGIDFMWYGIIITVGIILALVISYKRAPRHEIAPDKLLDVTMFCVPAGIIGARIYYVAFTWESYGGNLWDMINIRNGGLAIHGGLLLGMIVGWILCIKWKINPLNGLDLVVPGIALAQAIGRWGNYFNQEAHGGITNLPWGIIIDGEKVHPTFLYESIWCFLLFLTLIYIDNRRSFIGQTFLLYCILYSVERFFIEELRTDSLMVLGGFKQAQVLSIFIFIVGILSYIYLVRKEKKKRKIFFK